MAQTIQQVEIFPTNRASAANTWSYRNGNPTLEFKISQNNRAYLLSKSLYVHFKLRLRTAADAYPNNAGADGTAAVEVRQNAKIGALSVFQSINVSSAVNNASLERVQNAPRLAATLIPSGASFSSYSTELQLETGATSSDAAQGRRSNSEMEVCCRVMAGIFLLGAEIPLGEFGRGCGGLAIKFNLSPSVEANFGADAGGSYYEVVNPSLTFKLGVVDQLPPISALPYTSFSSYYNVLSNGDETQNINCALGSVISTFSNFVPTSFIANAIQDGNESYTLRNSPYTDDSLYAPITRYTTLKGGVKFPAQFSVNSQQLVTQSGTTFSARYTAQRELNFLSALQPSKDRIETLAGNISESGLGVSPTSTENSTRYNTLSKHIYGCGSRFDGLGNGAGSNFKQAQFSHRIESSLDGVSPNSIYSFFLHRNLVNMSSNGIAVSN